jgi:hypothetical protein
MARDTLADLIENLRGLADAGTADWTNGTATFWDADQLQAVLDRHRMDVSREELLAVPQYGVAGAVSFYEYRSSFRNFEETDGGTVVFYIQDAEGNTLSSWSAEYARGVVTFASDQEGLTRYLTGRKYDLNASAADVWRVKAANAAKMYDFSTDNHNLRRSQFYDHCVKMAEQFEVMAEPSVITMFRSDLG